jgi:CRISPR/Cas system-associated protein Csm6
MSEELGRKFEELREFVSKLVESSGETMSSDLNDLLLALVSKLEEEESPQGQSQEQGQHL